VNPLALSAGQLEALVWTFHARREQGRARERAGTNGTRPELSPQRMRMRRKLGVS
jgi:hypothetical protein